MPAIIAKSISILSDAGLGMAMFSLGQYNHPSFVTDLQAFRQNSLLQFLYYKSFPDSVSHV